MPKGGLAGLIAAALARPEARGIPDGDPRLPAVHAGILRADPFLRRLYLRHYRRIRAALRGAPPGPVLEIGSGVGFLGEVIPGAVTTDAVAAPGASRVMRAESIDAADGSLAAIVMLNAFHHLPDPAAFLREAARTLAPGGRVVMVEPAHTPLWSRLWRAFSPEPYDPGADWDFDRAAGGANVPKAWIVFVRDRGRFEREHASLRVSAMTMHTAFLFLLAGGFRFRGLAPGWSFPVFAALESVLAPLMPLLAGQVTVVLGKDI